MAMKYLSNEQQFEDTDEYFKTHRNDIFVNFPWWEDKELLDFVITSCKMEHFDFIRAKESGRRIVKDDACCFWQEEHMAIICTQLYFLLPIAARIEFLSEFMGRTEKQIRALLGIGVTFCQISDENDRGLLDLYLDYWWRTLEWFNRFYKAPQANIYPYRDKPYSK